MSKRYEVTVNGQRYSYRDRALALAVRDAARYVERVMSR